MDSSQEKSVELLKLAGTYTVAAAGSLAEGGRINVSNYRQSNSARW